MDERKSDYPQSVALERHAVVSLVTSSLLGIALVPAVFAAESAVPPPIRIALTLRILEYDRGLKSWAGSNLTVGFVTKKGAAELRQGLTGQNAQGVALTPVEHMYRDAGSLGDWIDKNGVRLLCLSPELEAEAKAICAIASVRNVPTLASTRAQFQAGGTLGIIVKAGKPHILVSLPASKAAGMDLDPKLLQLAEVVR